MQLSNNCNKIRFLCILIYIYIFICTISVLKIMMVTNSDDPHNKHSFAKSSINSKRGRLFKICASKITTARRIKTQTATADAEKYLLQKRASESPKEYFSPVTLTRHLLRIITPTTHPYRKKNYISIYNNNEPNNNSIHSSNFVKCCDSISANLSGTTKSYKEKMNQKSDFQLQNLQNNSMPILTSTHITTVSTHRNSNFSESFNFRHKKCNTRKTRTIKSATSTEIPSNTLTLQQRKHQVVAIATLKPVPLMKSVTNKSIKRRQTKSQTSNINSTIRFRSLPSFKVTSLFSLLTLICLETVLLSTVSNCAKTFYMHWNTSNSIFRIDNTDHIIDVNKGNLAFEFDQVHIICPVYEPGTFENETEKYIIYNVSKVEYETCRITNADPRVIAICDKPQKLMFFTITFRPFTPQPGGLEFLPGNDYYFISTSSKDDLYRRIGGRCSTNNMKVVFKVCCAPEDKNNITLNGGTARSPVGIGGSGFLDSFNNVGSNGSRGMNFATSGTSNQQHINSIGPGVIHGGGININNGIQQPKTQSEVTSGTSINTNIDQYNRIPTITNGVGGLSNGVSTIGTGGHGNNGVLLPTGSGHSVVGVLVGGGATSAGGHQKTGIRINNVPTSQQHPSENNNGDDDYNKHPNEVVKNEELTYNSASSIHHRYNWEITSLTTSLNSLDIFKNIRIRKLTIIDMLLLDLKSIFSLTINPILIISILLSTLSTNVFKFNLRTKSAKILPWKLSLRKSTKASAKMTDSFAANQTQISNNNVNKIVRNVFRKQR